MLFSLSLTDGAVLSQQDVDPPGSNPSVQQQRGGVTIGASFIYVTLGGLYGDRIDLAIGRAPGSDPITAYALQRDRRTAGPDDFPEAAQAVLAELWARLKITQTLQSLSDLEVGGRDSRSARTHVQRPLKTFRLPDDRSRDR